MKRIYHRVRVVIFDRVYTGYTACRQHMSEININMEFWWLTNHSSSILKIMTRQVLILGSPGYKI